MLTMTGLNKEFGLKIQASYKIRRQTPKKDGV